MLLWMSVGARSTHNEVRNPASGVQLLSKYPEDNGKRSGANAIHSVVGLIVVVPKSSYKIRIFVARVVPVGEVVASIVVIVVIEIVPNWVISPPNLISWFPRVQVKLSDHFNVARCNVVGPSTKGDEKPDAKMVGGAGALASAGVTLVKPSAEGGVLSVGTP